MEPICFYAVFADGHKEQQNGVDLIGVHNQVTSLPQDPNQTGGVAEHLMTLYIQIAADPGHHVLSFSHDGYEYVRSAEFDVPATGMWLLGVERDFPLTFNTQDDYLNVFPILLDNVPFTNAYIVTHSL